MDEEDVARLRIALGRISRALDRQTRGDTLTRTQASVLATAVRLGPVRITELAGVEGVNPTMLSRIVAKLEATGLLARHPDPADGRAALVEPTAAGTALALRLRAERSRLLAEHLADLPGAAALLDALPALDALARSLTAEPRREAGSPAQRPGDGDADTPTDARAASPPGAPGRPR